MRSISKVVWSAALILLVICLVAPENASALTVGPFNLELTETGGDPDESCYEYYNRPPTGGLSNEYLRITTTEPITISMAEPGTVTECRLIFSPTNYGDARVTLNGVQIDRERYGNSPLAPIELTMGSMDLTLQGENRVVAPSSGYAAGLQSNMSRLTIHGPGSLEARGGNDGGAGIGGNGTATGIHITGGTITAVGGVRGAGIGGGHIGSAYDIEISGGSVFAQGGLLAAGIGGGGGYQGGAGFDITVSGGNVTAIGGAGGAGIGSGNASNAYEIYITGGQISAAGGGHYIEGTSDADDIGGGSDAPWVHDIFITGGRFADANAVPAAGADLGSVYGWAASGKDGSQYAVVPNNDANTSGTHPFEVVPTLSLASFSLTPRDIFLYDGEPLEPTDFILSRSSELDVDKLTFSYRSHDNSNDPFVPGLPTDAGAWTIRASILDGETLNGVYFQPSSVESSVQIVPAHLQFSIEDASVSADTALRSLEFPDTAYGVNGAPITGSVTWYLDEGLTRALPEDYVFQGDPSDCIVLWWRFNPDHLSANYSQEVVSGSTTFTLLSDEFAGGEDTDDVGIGNNGSSFQNQDSVAPTPESGSTRDSNLPKTGEGIACYFVVPLLLISGVLLASVAQIRNRRDWD